LLCFQMFRSRKVSALENDPELAEKLRKAHQLEETPPMKKLQGNDPKVPFSLDCSGKKKKSSKDKKASPKKLTTFLPVAVNEEETNIGVHESVEFLLNNGAMTTIGEDNKQRKSNYL